MGKKRKKRKKSKTTSGDGGIDYRLSSEAIEKSTGLEDTDELEAVKNQIYIDENNSWPVVVVTLDIRKSSIALVNLEDFELYSEVITDYVCYVMKTCQSKTYSSNAEVKDKDRKIIKIPERGWFDKFTGDGVIVFWRLPLEPYAKKEKYYGLPETTPYDDKVSRYNQKFNEMIRIAVEFSIEVTAQFLENVLPEIRQSCGLLPCDFGLSVGIDAGECLLTELKASENFPDRSERYGLDYKKAVKKGEIVTVSPSVTAIGRSVIGANRMVSKAKPYEILINSYPGANLKLAMDSKDEVCQGIKFSLEPNCVCTKEYNPVEAYRVVSGRIEQLKKTKTFCYVSEKTPQEKTKQICNKKNIESETKNDE